MPTTLDYTIAYERDGIIVDVCKIIFGGDGSYYVTTPYHPHSRALLSRITVNYAVGEPHFSLDTALDVAVVDDEKKRLKISHHRDGFLQFSGEGIISGRTKDGKPKGIGTRSWPLSQPTLGPAFALSLSDPLKLGRPSAGKKRTVVFHEADIEHNRFPQDRSGGVGVTAYYFPVGWRQFVRRVGEGEYNIYIVNPPTQAVLPLRVLLSSASCGYPGFIGLEVEARTISFPNDEPGFFVSTATGDLRRNDEGELLGDQLVCMYPAAGVGELHIPTLNLRLPAPAYRAPGGPSA